MAPRRERVGFSGATWRLTAVVAVSAAMGLLVAGLVLPLAGLAGLATNEVAERVDDLPKELGTEPLAERTRVLDRRGKVVATFYEENRKVVPLKKIDPTMRRAILAIEDSRFFEHGALDLRGTLRAFVENQAADGPVQGGSTITQQLVKMTLVDQADTEAAQEAATEQTYRRKIDELRYAIALEKQHSKRWILHRYLNLAYFGAGAYGVEAAAERYFSRSAKKLSVRQAALLAGLVKNPTGYDPLDNPQRAKERRNVVLARMAELGVISQKRATKVSKRNLGLKPSTTPNGCLSSQHPWFCDFARSYMLQQPALGKNPTQRERALNTGGLTIHTTLDQRAQRAADAAVRRHVRPQDRAVGALAMVQPGTGKVRAVAQSRPMGTKRGKGETFLNFVVPTKYGDAAGFQAGSTFKVFVLAAAIDQGIPLSTTIKAPPRVSIPVSRFRGCDGTLTSNDTWEPANSTGSGTFDLRTGTQQSVNTLFAQLELLTGLCRPYRLADQMGVQLGDPDNQQVPAFTLGVVDTDPLTMAEAYATFAARGRHCESRPVRKVTDGSGKVVARFGKDCQRVLSKGEADAVSDVLRGVQEPGGFGYEAGISLSQPSAGKTGTTNSNQAVWFVGYTPTMSAAAMIAGADRQGRWKTLNGQVVGGQRIGRASGSRDAGPIWGDAMQVAQRWLPDRGFVRPDPQIVSGRSTAVPDVRGQTAASAALRLRQAGLQAVLPGGRLPGTSAAQVVRTRPGAGTQVDAGRRVRLVVTGG